MSGKMVARGLVAEAVAEELCEVLAALGLDASVTVRQNIGAALVSSGAAGVRRRGPTVLVDVPPGDGAVLAQALKGQSRG
ncbi:hypothetical protein [Streptomyces iconiensis]|uniref:Uncharacterized protein n=1 Tax=Streptomyces iconiensis TaxID=1384038 RepID=A0ABT6ZNT5_9ACTN|nr:hypothetical protein [Streptomyces iconiensis]MDJ1130717.1 hypothetical protein [Streptomyces iconiensis]